MEDFFDYTDKDIERRKPDSEKEPWWNDGDKVGGLAATIFVLGIAILLFAGCIKLVTMMF